MNNHMMQCPRKTLAQRKTIVELRSYLGKIGTNSAVSEEFCHGIEEWLLSGTEKSVCTENSEETRGVANKQQKIRWRKAMRG
jgi:hypothetical protein